MLKSAVEAAIVNLREYFQGLELVVKEDTQGGAEVLIENVPLTISGHPYAQEATWVGFRIPFQTPYADIYPVFVRGDLIRRDGKALGSGTSKTKFLGREAVQLSRRSKNRDPELETVVDKIVKVLTWLQQKT